MRVRTSPSSTASMRYSSAISTCCFPARILLACRASTRTAERSMASRRSWPASGAAISESSILRSRRTRRWRVAEARVEARPIARRDANGARDRARRVGPVRARSSQDRARRDAALCPHARRQARDAAAHLSGADRRRSDRAARQRGPARLRRAARGCARRPRLAADSFSGGAVQMRRAQRTLCLYGHRRGAARDQGRGGHLPVPQQSEGG